LLVRFSEEFTMPRLARNTLYTPRQQNAEVRTVGIRSDAACKKSESSFSCLGSVQRVH